MSRIASPIVAVLLAGCGASPAPPPPRVVPPPEPVASAAPPAVADAPIQAAVPPPSACVDALRGERAKLRPFFLENRRVTPDFDGRAFVAHACDADDRGAWLLSVSDLRVEPSEHIKIPYAYDTSPRLSGKLRPVRIDASGARAEGPPIPFAASPTYDHPPPFDWSGDGVPELPVVVDAGQPPVLVLYAFDRGKVAPYTAAVGISVRGVRDVDGDGRPDLLYAAPYEGSITQYASYPTSVEADDAWLLVAHALPDGTFSRDDDVALRAVKDACAGAAIPGAIAKDEYPAGAIEIAAGVRCARLRGESTETVIAAIEHVCRGYRGFGAPRGGGCPDEGVFRAWAKAPPPFRLR